MRVINKYSIIKSMHTILSKQKKIIMTKNDLLIFKITNTIDFDKALGKRGECTS